MLVRCVTRRRIKQQTFFSITLVVIGKELNTSSIPSLATLTTLVPYI